MSYSSGQIVLAVSNSGGGGSLWTQILVLVVFASLVGVYSLVRTRRKRFDGEEDYPEYTGGGHIQARRQKKSIKALRDEGLGIFLKASRAQALVEERVLDFEGDEAGRERDLAGGMEMLELDFLVRIAERTEGDDEKDVTMRKLSFYELVRRNQLKAADSNALRVYATNKGNLYGKDIQQEAMKELAERTRVRL